MNISDRVFTDEATQCADKQTGTHRISTATNRPHDRRFHRPRQPLFYSVSPSPFPQREKRSCRGLLRRMGYMCRAHGMEKQK